MKFLKLLFFCSLSYHGFAQVQFAIVCNQKTYQLELIISGKQEPHQLVLRDHFPNQAVAETFMRDNGSNLNCADPSKPSNVIRQISSGPPPKRATGSVQNPKPAHAVGFRTLQYKTSRLGIYTFKPVHVESEDGINIKQTSLPTFYLSTGRDVVPQFALNFEMLFNYKSVQTDQSLIHTKSQAYTLAGGLQAEFRIPVPTDVVTPYLQASLGYMHSFYFSEFVSKTTEYKYDFNLGMFYNNLGVGGVFHISDGFGLFAEGGYTWSRTLQTLGEINSKILESQGIDPGTIVPDSPPFNEKIKGNNLYFKVGFNFRLPSN
jgi:hypothetical protein